MWIAEVGWDTWEEINTIANPADLSIGNFGWPCYEGVNRQPGYDAANLPICESLYTAGSARSPYYQYTISGSAAVSGVALYRGNNFPPQYDGALFFTDYTQGWIKVMLAGGGGLPNAGNAVDFIAGGTAAVDLQIAPSGQLFYADIASGAIHTVRYVAQNTAPTARIAASATYGALPLTVMFDGSGSSDPDAGDSLSYAWDLDGDGQFDDSSLVAPTFTYTSAAIVVVGLRVTDSHGEQSVATVVIDAGNTPPVATINAPTAALTYSAGQTISFSGGATNAQGNPLPASALNWKVVLNHCAVENPSDCHEHFVREIDGAASGAFEAPVHGIPSTSNCDSLHAGTLTDVASVIC